MAGQNKSSMRRKLRSALAHKKLADELLDSMLDTQSKWNATLDKLEADDPATLDTDYEADGAITDVFEADGEGSEAQHKASLRASLRSALAHRRLADEMCDALEEMQTAYNALLVKLDAEAGTLDDGDYVSSLAVSVMDPDAEGSEAQHKASMRKSLRSALANESLADSLLDAIVALQESFNAELALLDTDDVVGSEDFKVSPISPDAE